MKEIVIYLSPYDLLRPRTNQVSDVRFAEGFSQNGIETHIIAPFVFRKDNISKQDLPAIYGLEADINVHYLNTNYTSDINGYKAIIKITFLAYKYLKKLLKKPEFQNSTIYIISRSAVILQPFLLLKKRIANKSQKIITTYWAHDFKSNLLYKRTYLKSDHLLATNSSIAEDIQTLIKPSKRNISITLNPITKKQLISPITKSEARNKIDGLSKEQKLIVYTGKLGIEYDLEIKHILDAAKAIPYAKFLLTGGKPEALLYWKNYCNELNIQNVIFTGYVHDYSQIIYYQKAADILLSYYTKQGHNTKHNLPNKLCEYMVTGNPIITPNYPATRDLLNSNNCFFAEPENSLSLIKTIKDVMENEEKARLIGEQAYKDVQDITFGKVTNRIFNKLK